MHAREGGRCGAGESQEQAEEPEPKALAILSFVITLPVLAANTSLRWYSWPAAVIVGGFSWRNFFLVSGYSWGHHGTTYTITCIVASFAFNVALAGVWIRLRRRASFALVALFHAVLSLWIATYAFSYLGEVL